MICKVVFRLPLIARQVFLCGTVDDAVRVFEKEAAQGSILPVDEAWSIGLGDDVVATDAIGFDGAVHVVAQVAHVVAGGLGSPGKGEVEGDTSVGITLALVGNEITQGIDGDAGGVPVFKVVLQRLHDMRVRTDDDVRTLAVQESGEAFLLCILTDVVFDAPVHAHDDVGGGVEARLGDMAGDVKGVDHGNHLAFAGRDAVGAVCVAEKCEFEIPVADVQRGLTYPTCRVRKSPGVGNAEGVEVVNCAADACGMFVAGMIVVGCEDVHARTVDVPGELPWGAELRISAEPRIVEGGFKVADDDVGLCPVGGDVSEAGHVVVGALGVVPCSPDLRFVLHDVPDEEQGKGVGGANPGVDEEGEEQNVFHRSD